MYPIYLSDGKGILKAESRDMAGTKLIVHRIKNFNFNFLISYTHPPPFQGI